MSFDKYPELTFALAEPPANGKHTEVLPGINWIRLPLPFALDHVNCWLLHDDTGSCLIDSGVNTKQTLDCWNQVIADTGWPEQLLVTHFHPDHSGLAGWFASNGAQVLSSKIEWGIVQNLNAIDDAAYQEYYAQWYAKNGVEQSYIDAVLKVGNTFKGRTLPPPATCSYLQDGDSIELGGRSFAVLTGQGHSPDMVMLYCEQDVLLIAADQVLPSISPNVSLMPNTPDENPLGSFLACLERLKELPEETLVLPSHGLPFTGLHQRIEFLIEHHQIRLQEVEQALEKEQQAAALFPLLFKRKLDHQQLSFALGETLAHLRLLEYQDKVTRTTRNGEDFYRANQ